LTLLVGWQEGHPVCKNYEWWGAGVVICLEQGADLHMAQLMPLPTLSLASVKSKLVLPFWYRLIRVVPEKGPLNGCMCVCVCITGSQLPITTSQPAKYCSGEASKENANMGQNAQPYKSHGVVNHDLCTLLSVYFS